MRPSRDETMLRLAETIAERSTCRRRKVGCILTDHQGRVLSVGHNGVPMGMEHCGENPTLCQLAPSGVGLEACRAVHAEQNALLFCQDVMRIDTCYATVSPCIHCVKMLLNTSVRRVVFREPYAHDVSAFGLWLQSRQVRDPDYTWIKLTDPRLEVPFNGR